MYVPKAKPILTADLPRMKPAEEKPKPETGKKPETEWKRKSGPVKNDKIRVPIEIKTGKGPNNTSKIIDEKKEEVKIEAKKITDKKEKDTGFKRNAIEKKIQGPKYQVIKKEIKNQANNNENA